MADFFQNGVITTLQKLGNRSLEEMESELIGYGERHRMVLLLPALYSEFKTPAMHRIIDELLFLSRADAGAVLLELRPQSPVALLSTFGQDASALAEHGGKVFDWSHRGEGEVNIDGPRIRQVLLNLLTNALVVHSVGYSIECTPVCSFGRF